MARPARKPTRATAKAASLPRARKAAAKKRVAKSASLPRARKTAAKPARRVAAPSVATTTVEQKAPPAGKSDLAGGLRTYLGAIETEVRAVSALSERIDVHVAQLNDLRDQQAKRLLVLDELRGSVADQSLGAFLDQLIKPRKTRVSEVIPKRVI